MGENYNYEGTIFDEQGEMIVREQLMDSYREGTVGSKPNTRLEQEKK